MVNNCHRRSFLKTGFVSAIGLTALAGCLGDDDEEYPSQTITYVVPFSAGGGTDLYGRQIMPEAGEALGTSIQVENIDGAGGLRGQQEVYNADPDGYTFGASDEPLVAALVSDIDWDPTEKVPICGYGETPFMIVADPDLEIEDFDDLVARYRDGELNTMAGDEAGGFQHIVALVLNDQYDLGFEDYVGFGGSDPINQAVASGDVPAGVVTDTSAVGPADDGLIDPIVITSTSGSQVFPDLPDVTEFGYDDIDHVGGLVRTMWATPETPEDRAEQLTDAVEEAIQSDAVQDWSEETGNDVQFIPPDRAMELRVQGMEELPEQVNLDELD